MDPKQIQPLGDRVLVEALVEPEQTRGGVIIPEMSQNRPERAVVLAVGPGTRQDDGTMIPVDLQAGDHVIFHRHAGTHIGGLDDSFIVFREQDILARVLDPQEPDA